MIIKKHTYIYIAILVSSIHCFSQQVPHYTQYIYNMQVYNPAAVGVRSNLDISLLSRSQWVGIEGAPTTQTLSINTRSKNGFGIGSTFINDKVGLAKSITTNIDASYTLATSLTSRLAFGLKGGFNFFSNNLAQGITPDNDTYQSTSGSYPNIGFGALFYNENCFFGLSIPYLLKSSKFAIDISNDTELTNSVNYFFTGGAKFKINNDVIIKPSTLIKYTTNLPISIDVNANVLFMQKVEGGISYRHDDAVSAMLALIFWEKFRVGYAYENKITDFGNNLNTHEILLHVDFNLRRQGRWLRNNSCYF